ncbi:hypothetical protein CYMTET_12703 [Cymbomonas tetramitiformis]|uniref:Uncharacterized protein n=1 Tax=Cymbomonas tetramitiformis TaxID=36881 RepID=A0AAE0GJS1_9CHLO|nr:hypothetical protein CYMTET_12703 [Cymbomonas tetramitiformis]|eukprot:gene1013-1538_t
MWEAEAEGKPSPVQAFCAPLCDCCCIPFSRFGLLYFNNHRREIYTLALGCYAVALALCIVGVVGVSNNEKAVIGANWAYGDVQARNVTVFIALNAFSTENGTNTWVQQWDDTGCNLGGEPGADMQTCNACKDASQGSVVTVIMALITKIPGLGNILARGGLVVELSDSPFKKFASVLGGFLQPFMLFYALLNFRINCFDELPDRVTIYDMEWFTGPGYYSLSVAILFDLVVAVVHFFMPNPRLDDDEFLDAISLGLGDVHLDNAPNQGIQTIIEE